MKQKTDKAPDMGGVTSQLGGFVDNEDSCSVVADRKEVVGLTKSGRRSTTVRTTNTPTILWFHHSHILIPGCGFNYP